MLLLGKFDYHTMMAILEVDENEEVFHVSMDMGSGSLRFKSFPEVGLARSAFEGACMEIISATSRSMVSDYMQHKAKQSP